jgi:hypothetical protein
MKGAHTPFVFAKTVSMVSFTKREEEFEKLKSNLLIFSIKRA